MVLPVLILNWKKIFGLGMPLHLIAIPAGLAVVLYSNAFHFTDVVRVVILFYLTPIWSTLLARIWLKEKVGTSQFIAIIFGFLGLLVIFDVDQSFPIPKNVGDWMALASGLFWAIAANAMRRKQNLQPVYTVSCWMFWAMIFSSLMAFFTIFVEHTYPALSVLSYGLFWLIPFSLLLILPGFFLIAWGVPFLNPGIVGILFMTEISVGVISASLLTDEIIGIREITGVALITLAGIVPLLVSLITNFRNDRFPK